MNTSILAPLLGSMLAMAPIVDSTVNFKAELKRPPLTDNSLVVHEWGTFTALQGSNGSPQNGMQHEEESLPAFVHSRDLLNEQFNDPNAKPCPRFCKGFEPGTIFRSADDVDHLLVTQKMETPVVYFYSKNDVKNVRVSVGFPQGVISQYYPAAESFSPALGQMNMLRNGRVDFAFDIAAEGKTLETPSVDSENVYAPSRNVNANYIRNAQGENEKLIFYRGLGHFSTSIRILSDQKGIYIHNNSKDLPTQAGILFYSNGADQGGFYAVKAIAPAEVIFFSQTQVEAMQTMHAQGLIEKSSEALVAQLEASGLFHDEAVSMVNTWKKSYFKTKGLRFLHILARKETEELLPLTMTPQPTELVRTLVGRVEIMTFQEEQEILGHILKQREAYSLAELGRLAEPKLRRVKQIAPVELERVIDQLIAKAVRGQI